MGNIVNYDRGYYQRSKVGLRTHRFWDMICEAMWLYAAIIFPAVRVLVVESGLYRPCAEERLLLAVAPGYGGISVILKGKVWRS